MLVVVELESMLTTSYDDFEQHITMNDFDIVRASFTSARILSM
jgi:hypothetical protein